MLDKQFVVQVRVPPPIPSTEGRSWGLAGGRNHAYWAYRGKSPHLSRARALAKEAKREGQIVRILNHKHEVIEMMGN